MSCSHPRYAINFGKDFETGKMHIKFANMNKYHNVETLERVFGVDNVFAIPCGKCDGCKLDYRSEWSVRCMLESTLYADNCFITLTYDSSHYPGDIVRKDLKSFLDILNHHHKIRYFACAERGKLTGRCHFHAILFGYRPDDLTFWCYSKGEPIYRSKYLESIWKKGNILIGDVTEASCSYVAGYVGKKVDDSGWLVMSNRPGIGAAYFESHFHDIYAYDNIVLPGGRVVSPPRYCDILAERAGFDLTATKQRRLLNLRIGENQVMRDHGYVNREMTFNDKLIKNQERVKRLKRNAL